MERSEYVLRSVTANGGLALQYELADDRFLSQKIDEREGQKMVIQYQSGVSLLVIDAEYTSRSPRTNCKGVLFRCGLVENRNCVALLAQLHQ